MGDESVKVNEIFYSIEGEGIRQGYPCVFLRLAGCNLNCSYCDTGYAKHLSQGTEMSEEAVLKEVLSYDCPRVTITGGEPLLSLSEELLAGLWDEGVEVNIETNGSLDPRPFMMSNVIITMDYKLPSSGMEGEMNEDYIDELRGKDVLKFVAGSAEDLERAKEIIEDHNLSGWSNIFFSPVFGRIHPQRIATFLKENNIDARLQLQIHKIIWDSNTRGV